MWDQLTDDSYTRRVGWGIQLCGTKPIANLGTTPHCDYADDARWLVRATDWHGITKALHDRWRPGDLEIRNIRKQVIKIPFRNIANYTAPYHNGAILGVRQSLTFYLIHGDDDLALDQVLDKLRAGKGDNGDLNTSEFEGDETTVAEVIGAVRSMPFLADKRLVIVKNLVSHITRQGAGQRRQAGSRTSVR